MVLMHGYPQAILLTDEHKAKTNRLFTLRRRRIMANKPHHKLRLLHLLKPLIEKTDASYRLTTQQIIDELCCIDFDIERKTLYRDI